MDEVFQVLYSISNLMHLTGWYKLSLLDINIQDPQISCNQETPKNSGKALI